MSYLLGLALGTGTDKTESIFFSFLLEGCKGRTFDFFALWCLYGYMIVCSQDQENSDI